MLQELHFHLYLNLLVQKYFFCIDQVTFMEIVDLFVCCVAAFAH